MHKAGAVQGAMRSRSMFGLLFKTLRKAPSLCALFTLPALLLASASAQQATAAHFPSTTHLSAITDEAGRATFQVKVEAGDRGVPSGAVTLSSGRSSLGSVLLDENGEATYTAAVGDPEQVTAVYEGDGSFNASSSLTVAVPAASTLPTFTLSATPTTLSVKTGNNVTSTVTVTPANGFNGSVLLSCSGLPTNSTCAFNPVYAVPGGTPPNTTPATSTLTIQTVQSTTMNNGAPGGNPLNPRTPLYAVLVPGLALAGLGLLRKRAFGLMRVLGIAALMLGCVAGLSACSPRYDYFAHPPLRNPGTTLGTFTVLVSGASATAGSDIIPTPVSIILTVTD